MKEEIKELCKKIAGIQWQINWGDLSEKEAEIALEALSEEVMKYTTPQNFLYFAEDIDDYVQQVLNEMEKQFMTENGKKVYDYLAANQDLNLTADDVAQACQLTTKQVDGIFTLLLQKKNLGERVSAQMKKEDRYVDVKYLKLIGKWEDLNK